MWAVREWPLRGWKFVAMVGLGLLAIGGSAAGVIWASHQAAAQTAIPNVNGNCNNFGNYNINCNTFNLGPQKRDLDSPWGQPLKEQMLQKLPRDKEITVESILGDSESGDLAVQIYNFLKANGFELKEKGISQGVFTPPVHGLNFNSATNTFIVGSQ